MKKFVALLLASVLMVTSGCGTWWSNFKADPVAQTTSVINTAQTIVQIAQAIFWQLKPFLAAEKQPVAQAKFDAAVTAVFKAEGALQSAVQAAVEIKSSSPDLTKVFADLAAAVLNLQAVVAEIKSLAGSTGAGVGGQDELAFHVNLLTAQTRK
jgi:hypothetical protein